jgi:hypothetical protein
MDKNLNDIKQRILQFIDYKKVTRDKFFTPLGLSVQNFKGKALESALSADSMVKILSLHPDLNPNWLMYGDGEMLKHDIPNTQNQVPFTQFQANGEHIAYLNEDAPVFQVGKNEFTDIGNGYYQMLVPFIEDYAYAGYLSGYSDEKYLGELPRYPIIVQKQHRGNYRSIRVRGDSMDDNSRNAICPGDIVVGRRVEKDLWRYKIHYNTWPNFIIVHEDGIVIKSIIDHDVEKGTITCRSLNPNKDYYPDYKMDLSKVYELYNIVQTIRSY